VVLGDFNAEPYDGAFHAHPTSRDRIAALRHRPKATDDLLLYNLSWRWMGESEPWNGSEAPSFAGTYNNGKYDPNAWKTFDQILVSPSLLTASGWLLREDLSGVHRTTCRRATGCRGSPGDRTRTGGGRAWAK
jgi:hypothetical protein